MSNDVGKQVKGGKKPMVKSSPKLAVVGGDKVVALARGQGRNPHGLTSKQEAFAVGVGTRGETLAQAYRSAYDAAEMTPHTIHNEACKLMANPVVAARVNALVMEKQAKTSLDSTRILNHVRERLHIESIDPTSSPSARIRALELLGKLGTVAAFDRTTDDTEQSTAHEIADTLQAKLRTLLNKTG